MRSSIITFSRQLCLPVFVCFLTLVSAAVQAEDIKLEAQLLWGTNDKTSPNPKHKPVEEKTRKKLKELPLKWTNYFEETKKEFKVSEGASTKINLSERCDIEVKYLGHNKVELNHFGKGEKVVKQTQALPKGETLVLGGNAPNETAWLVVLKRIE
jgi:hypothetical protein